MPSFVAHDRKLDERSLYLRSLVVDALEGATRGHIGPSLSLIEILRVLYDSFLNVDPCQPKSPHRDRMILSKGHGCLALYALLADKGFFPLEELPKFCSHTSFLGGHPEYGHIPGVEASTGALGHGLSIGIGIALASRIKGNNIKVAVVLGDGELNEGSIWEAALSCAKHKLSNLFVFIDRNHLQCYGKTEDVLDMEPLNEKWKSFGFNVIEVDGHDVGELIKITDSLKRNKGERPSVVICNTIKGKGFPFAEGDPTWHYKHFISTEDISLMRDALDSSTFNL